MPWWSFTKTVLAAAALSLVERKELDLAQRITGEPYTLRQLLQHTAGLPDYGGLREYHAAVSSGDKPWPRELLLERVKANQLLFEPGRSWSYSNVGYLFVREMIEQRAGMDLGAALGRLVFEPMGIEAVSVARSAADLDRTFWGNDRHYDPGWVYHGLIIGPPAGAAMLLHRLLYSSFLTSSLKAEMLNAVAAGGPFPGRPFVAPGYGLGLMIDPANRLGRMVGHTGQGPGSTAAVYSFSGCRESRTLAAFIAADGPNAQGRLEMHLQNLASDEGPSCQTE